jgi:hypothetical protein
VLKGNRSPIVVSVAVAGSTAPRTCSSGVVVGSPLEGVLAVLPTARRNGGGWSARCPAHDDRVASLSVSEGDDGRALLHCHAGCDTSVVLEALNLDAAALFPPKATSNGSHVVATYRYTDERGTVLFEKVRFSPKRFVQRRPDGDGYTYNLDGVRRVPYRLPELLEGTRANRWVLIVEGEKAADRLLREGFVATCGSGGAGKWHPEYAEHFAGAKVAVLADADEPGRKHAHDVARSLEGLAADVRLVELPKLPDKGDVFDWLEQGHDRAELQQLVLDAPAWDAVATQVATGGAVTTQNDTVEEGAALLDDVAAFIGRYVACSAAGRDAGALWIAHTHAFEAAETSPRFAPLSAEPQSGKTRYLEVLKLLVRAPLFAVNISEAALFRVIEARRPTVLHDEIDAVFGPKARDREDLRAMLNAGYERGATVERCVGEGSKLTVKSFPVFAPVAMAGIGKLPETVALRSIVVRMKRRAPNEPVAKLRRRQVAPEADMLRSRLEAWAAAHLAVLADAEPDMPDELDDRAADIWEPLVAIADAAGGDWPARARDAAKALFGARRDDEATIGVRLLADARDVFGDTQGFASGDLAGRLAAIEGAPWSDWTDKGFTPHALAKLLRRYDIRPDLHWLDSVKIRGYRRADFEDAWARYLTPPAVSVPTVLTVPRHAQQGQGLEHLEHAEHFSGDGLDPLDPEWERTQLATLDPDDVQRGQKIADIRAVAARARKEAR